ncbi:hypothetical protein LguiA_033865 [Lonicera macranthoides]
MADLTRTSSKKVDFENRQPPHLHMMTQTLLALSIHCNYTQVRFGALSIKLLFFFFFLNNLVYFYFFYSQSFLYYKRKN